MQATINELPNNEDAERNLIGLTLLNQHIPHGARALATTDFYSQTFREAWSACLELDADALPVEPLSVHAIMKRNRPNVADSFPVSALLATISGMANVNEKPFVSQIRNASTRRYLIRRLNESVKSLSIGEKGAIQNLKREINDLEHSEELKGNFVSLATIIERDVLPGLEDLKHGVSTKISTGFDAIDRIVGGGLSLSDVLLVAGLPGGGKSAFVLQLAANIAKQNIPVAFLSGEMSNKENGMRLLSQAAQRPNLNSAVYIPDLEYDYLLTWVEAIRNLPIYFDQRTSDLRSLSFAMRALAEEHGVKVLVIDYIQLMRMNRVDKHQRTERIAEVSQEVKRIAMEYGIAVVEVAQFNREGAKSGKPMMHDLEGSSQLEKDTSLIFIIDREEGTQKVTLRIVKGRNSGLCEIGGIFEGQKLTFKF